jgi:hypothetical protein
MANSLRNVERYSYSGDSETVMAFLSNNQAKALDSSSHEQNDGYLDLVELACRLSSRSTITDNEGSSTEREVSTYLLGQSLYTCDNDEWMKFAVDDSVRAIGDRDCLRSMTNMISESKAELIGSELIDGDKCYVLRFEPDSEFSREALASQALMARSATPVELEHTGMDALANGDDLPNGGVIWTAWVSADDYLLRRVVSDTKLSLAPQSPQELKDLRIESASQKMTTFSGFNEKKPIVLPEKAKHAKTASA